MARRSFWHAAGKDDSLEIRTPAQINSVFLQVSEHTAALVSAVGQRTDDRRPADTSKLHRYGRREGAASLDLVRWMWAGFSLGSQARWV